jgi:signal transduction histidine kinase
VQKKYSELESLWTRRSGWLAVAVAVVVSALGYFLDHFLMLQGIPRSTMLLITNTVTGVVAGFLVYEVARHERGQREIMRAQVETIADMNHHIRNALQVIAGLTAEPLSSRLEAGQRQRINESVKRVEWALREVLPRYAVSGEARRVPMLERRVVPRKSPPVV